MDNYVDLTENANLKNLTNTVSNNGGYSISVWIKVDSYVPTGTIYDIIGNLSESITVSAAEDKSIGDGSRIMAGWRSGEIVDIIGPLGNYWTGYEFTFPILIGGGVGIAPIFNLHNLLKKDQIQHICDISHARPCDPIQPSL